MKKKNTLKKDRQHGLIYYDSWDTDSSPGCDFIADYSSAEDRAVKKMFSETIWKCVDEAEDKYGICRLVAAGFTEREIAHICGMSQAAVNGKKHRLFSKIRTIMVVKKF